MSDTNSEPENKPLSAAELAAIRERAAAATLGPWHRDSGGGVWPLNGNHWDDYIVEFTHAVEDATFIAGAREWIPRLLATVDAYRVALRDVIEDAEVFGWESASITKARVLIGIE